MAAQLPSRAFAAWWGAFAPFRAAESDPVSAAAEAGDDPSRLRQRDHGPGGRCQERSMSQKPFPSSSQGSLVSPIIDLSSLSVEKAVAKLIEYANSISASDLFLVTEPNGISAQVRHLGHIKRVTHVPMEQGRRFISHVRACAGM